MGPLRLKYTSSSSGSETGLLFPCHSSNPSGSMSTIFPPVPTPTLSGTTKNCGKYYQVRQGSPVTHWPPSLTPWALILLNLALGIPRSQRRLRRPRLPFASSSPRATTRCRSRPSPRTSPPASRPNAMRSITPRLREHRKQI
ncbi:hypothetical protein B0H17DRAFT_1015370 [Mycena rosella]|uniref:Uncharacterized protein n=1 Tax=Mycena rosella TaxID=1033263 RepID=A0AAD7GBB5_MYCRO|nr:hypothetical protein B0H17DRAFT_1015370 [Mycena rosella]